MSSKRKTSTAAVQGAQLPAGNYTPHPLASFVPGEMGKEEFAALCTSIKEDGVRQPIIVFEGQILDGRHRYAACKELGIKTIPYNEFKGDKDAAIALVMDNNLHRRQLNSMQKAIVAARMCLVKVNPPTQKDAAARVGAGLQLVNLAVRLLNSNNTPLIKRAENGDATRAEVDELLYDRAAATEAAPAALVDGEEGDDAPLGGGTPSNVVKLPVAGKGKATPTVGSKPGHPERRAKETPTSRVVQHFKALSEKERVQFCIMAWSWLRPAVEAAQKGFAAQGGKTPARTKKAA